MPATETERTRGITLKVLDLSPLKPDIIKFVQEGKDPTVTDVSFHFRWATITDEFGRQHLICDEGVGAVFSDESPMQIDAWDATERIDPETGNKTFSTMAIVSVHLKPEDIADLPVIEEVDLADFVRVFGARLERNFWDNYLAITNA